MVWNTREIKNFFAQLEPTYDVDLYLKALGWTYDEYWFNVEWTESGFISSEIHYRRISATMLEVQALNVNVRESLT